MCWFITYLWEAVSMSPRPQQLLPMRLPSCSFAEACFPGTRRGFMQSKWRWKESSTSAAAHPSPHWRQPPRNQWKILQFWVQKEQMPGNGRADLLQLIHSSPFSQSCTCLKTSQSEWEESQRLQAPSDWEGGAAGPSACLSWFTHGAEAIQTVWLLL